MATLRSVAANRTLSFRSPRMSTLARIGIVFFRIRDPVRQIQAAKQLISSDPKSPSIHPLASVVIRQHALRIYILLIFFGRSY